MERETGIEPAPSAWKAEVLPLNYSRAGSTDLGCRCRRTTVIAGFLPSAPPGPRRFASRSDSLPANRSNLHPVRWFSSTSRDALQLLKLVEGGG